MGVQYTPIATGARRQGEVRLGAYFAFTVSGEASSSTATTEQTSELEKTCYTLYIEIGQNGLKRFRL